MGAELCELVGLFLLDGLKNIFGLNRVGLYRDDGLAVLPNSSGFKVEKLKKQTHAFFKSMGLRVTKGISTSDNWLPRCEAQLEWYLFYAS